MVAGDGVGGTLDGRGTRNITGGGAITIGGGTIIITGGGGIITGVTVTSDIQVKGLASVFAKGGANAGAPLFVASLIVRSLLSAQIGFYCRLKAAFAGQKAMKSYSAAATLASACSRTSFCTAN